MSRVHEPTIGDYTRERMAYMREVTAELDLDFGDCLALVGSDAYHAAFVRKVQQRRAELLEDLAAIRRRETDLTAQMVKVRAATVAELEVCERALDRAGAPYEVDDE